MDRIVLVKQVPDVSNIPEDAWDREKGTLRRAMLDSILNPLDLHALTFADRLAGDDPSGRTVFLTMGPPMAREVLVECLSRVPGEAILLTDSAFAGADTGATAYSLACAIRRIEREMFEMYEVNFLNHPDLRPVLRADTRPGDYYPAKREVKDDHETVRQRDDGDARADEVAGKTPKGKNP